MTFSYEKVNRLLLFLIDNCFSTLIIISNVSTYAMSSAAINLKIYSVFLIYNISINVQVGLVGMSLFYIAIVIMFDFSVDFCHITSSTIVCILI